MARRRRQNKGYLRPEHGSWLLTYRVYPESGKPFRETVTIGPAIGCGKLTEKQAERFAWDHYLSKVDQSVQHPKSLMTFGEFWETRYKQHAQLKLKKTTREQYFSLYLRWIRPLLEKKRLASIGVDEVEQAIASAIEGGKSTATARHVRKVVSAVFTRAKKLQFFFGDNPAQISEPPAIVAVRPPKSLSFDQVRSVIQSLSSPENAMCLTAVVTSMNAAELCGLQWRWCNLTPEWTTTDGEGIPPFTIAVRNHYSRGELGSLKTTSRRRNIPVPDLVVAELAKLKVGNPNASPDSFVFASRGGKPISENNTRRRKLVPIGTKMGVGNIGWHTLRHSHATFTEQLGMAASDRQALMGHGSIEMTDRYTHEDLRRIRTGLSKMVEKIMGESAQGQVQ